MIDEQIAALMAEHGIPGLGVLVARGGVPVLARGYGRANAELDVPVTADTVFAIASLTKLFTAQAVLLLVEAGQVTLDAPVRAYLPDLPAAWDGARVRHLLSHTSGIPNYTDVPAYWESTRLDVPREQILGWSVTSRCNLRRAPIGPTRTRAITCWAC